VVRWSFERSGGTYGHRRVRADPARRGVAVGEDLVRALMAEEGLVACQPRPWRVTTDPGTDAGAEDLLGRDFTAPGPGRVLVGDITYIHTWEGFVYLATVIDLYSKPVVGWAVADHMRTDLVTDALNMARRHQRLEPGCVFHSDRGLSTRRSS
jgi:putative transposase